MAENSTENKCPVCGNKECLHILNRASLIVHGIGSISLIACSECGCVYVREWDRYCYKKFTEKERKHG